MDSEVVFPVSALCLSQSLVVEIGVADGQTRSTYTNDEWLEQISSIDQLLRLDQNMNHPEILRLFRTFQACSQSPSLVVFTPDINAASNLIAFAGLEMGLRVFVVSDVRRHIKWLRFSLVA